MELTVDERIAKLEAKLVQQQEQFATELARLRAEFVAQKEPTPDGVDKSSIVNINQVTQRMEWTIDGFSSKERELSKGQSIWSPKFRAVGLDNLQLEFFPKGREKTTFDGFCSLFLWCPKGTKIRYQLWVGKFLRAPDEDEYQGRIGHGHSSFCPIEPEVDRSYDSITVGVNFLEVMREDILEDGVLLVSRSVESIVAKQAEVVQNRGINTVVWKINNISQKLMQFPRGASMWSRLFTAAGIREILLEFYPNGSTNTAKEGFCAFYIRCPEGAAIVVTLFVGSVKKGPIKATFDSLSGKGLPEFCSVKEQINREDDSIEVGIELQNQPNTTLKLES